MPSRGILLYPFNITSAPMLTAYKESKSDKVWFPGFPLSSLLATACGRGDEERLTADIIELARQVAELLRQAGWTINDNGSSASGDARG